MFKHLIVDYYPEHVPETQWSRDIALMKEHGFTDVRMLCFAWSRLERADGAWDFGWVHRFMALSEENGIGVVLCTPTAGPPAWLTHNHPETLATHKDGSRAAHGRRRHYCPTSRRYRDFSVRIAVQMQRELGGYSNVLAWQIDNELGFNRCYCGECETAFCAGLKERYGTLEALNEALGGVFWSQDFWEWDEVQLPRSGSPSPEMQQAFEQFYSDQITSFMDEQIQALRAAECKAPISTNMMGDFNQIDYWKMARSLDFVGFDNYSDQYTLAGNSLAHHLMRSLKGGKPYWTFENAINSVSPWLQSPPGFNIVHALSGLVHGEEAHTFFQWQTFTHGHEQDLQGFVDWSGQPRAKLAEVKKLRAILDELQAIEMPPLKPRVALIFSYQNYWGTTPYFGKAYYDGNSYNSYWPEVSSFYEALFDLGVGCDCVSPDGDFSAYDLVLAPGLTLVEDAQLEALRGYVAAGGTLFAGRKTFAKTPENAYRRESHPARLGDVFGLRVSESQSNEDGHDLAVRGAADSRPFRTFTLESEVGLPASQHQGWFETLELHGARPLYRYTDGYFPGACAAAHHQVGQGNAFYLGTRLERPAMKALMRRALQTAGVDCPFDVPPGAQLLRRGDVCFCTNHSDKPLLLKFPGEALTLAGTPAQRDLLNLPPYGWSVVRLPAGKRG